MKNLLLLILLGTCLNSYSQIEEPPLTFGFIGEYSLHYYKVGFSPVVVNAGAWVNNIPVIQRLGVFVGYSEFMPDHPKTIIQWDKSLTTMVSLRYDLYEDKISIMPFGSIGTNSLIDYGLRLGVKLDKGAIIHLGLTKVSTVSLGVTISVTKYEN